MENSITEVIINMKRRHKKLLKAHFPSSINQEKDEKKAIYIIIPGSSLHKLRHGRKRISNSGFASEAAINAFNSLK